MVSRFSTTVTSVPNAANIEAYSMPITPAPTTTIDAGLNFRPRMPSESSTLFFVELDTRRPRRLGAGGNHDVASAHRDWLSTGLVLHQHRVIVDKSGVAGVELDAVAD